MRPYVPLFLFLLLGLGCQAAQLRNRTARQAATLTDLQYQEVLNNLAMFAAQPDTVPYYSLANKGTTTVTDIGELGGTLNWDYQFLGMAGAFVNHLDKKSLSPKLTQQSVETWNTDSVLNPDKLFLMRCAYRKVVLPAGDPACQDCDAALAAFFKNNPKLLSAMHPGWFCAGACRDVPKGACYVGHYGHTYAWVTPEGMNDLATFTLAILDIATAADSAVLIPTPQQANELAIKATIERLKSLTDIYKQLPEGTAQEKEAKARFEARIQAEMAKLEALFGPQPPAEKRERFAQRLNILIPRMRLFAENRLDTEKLIDEFRAEQLREFDALVSEPPAPAPVFRLRKDFGTFPLPPNIVPQP